MIGGTKHVPTKMEGKSNQFGGWRRCIGLEGLPWMEIRGGLWGISQKKAMTAAVIGFL